jgi:hypothetical protein
LRTAAWIVGGVALVAAGTGLVLHLAARSNADSFNNTCAPLMMPLSGPGCRETDEAWQFDKRWSIVGYVSGAALAVTSTVLFLTSRPATTTRTHARLQCGPTVNGVSCAGIF